MAKHLVTHLMQQAQKQGIRRSLRHASDAGRPVYESLGFKATNKMRPMPD